MYNISPVNRRVVGSSPTWGAQKSPEISHSGLSLCPDSQGKKRENRPFSGSAGVQLYDDMFFQHQRRKSRNISEMVRFFTTIFARFSNNIGLVGRYYVSPYFFISPEINVFSPNINVCEKFIRNGSVFYHDPDAEYRVNRRMIDNSFRT